MARGFKFTTRTRRGPAAAADRPVLGASADRHDCFVESCRARSRLDGGRPFVRRVRRPLQPADDTADDRFCRARACRARLLASISASAESGASELSRQLHPDRFAPPTRARARAALERTVAAERGLADAQGSGPARGVPAGAAPGSARRRRPKAPRPEVPPALHDRGVRAARVADWRSCELREELRRRRGARGDTVEGRAHGRARCARVAPSTMAALAAALDERRAAQARRGGAPMLIACATTSASSTKLLGRRRARTARSHRGAAHG